MSLTYQLDTDKMLTTQRLIGLLRQTAAKRGHNPTCYGVSKIMGISDNVVNRWVREDKTMSDENGLKAAEILGISPEYVIACLNAERAKEPEVLSIWTRICKLLEGENDLPQHA